MTHEELVKIEQEVGICKFLLFSFCGVSCCELGTIQEFRLLCQGEVSPAEMEQEEQEEEQERDERDANFNCMALPHVALPSDFLSRAAPV